MVGLASRRILLHHNTDHMVAQVLRLQQPHGGETSMRRMFDVVYPMAADQRRHVSINSARWLPEPGLGLAYGTNKGDLVICRPVDAQLDGDGPAEHSEPVFAVNNNRGGGTGGSRDEERPGSSRAPLRSERDMGLMNAIGLQPRHPTPVVTSQGTQTPIPQLQNAETQTDRDPQVPSTFWASEDTDSRSTYIYTHVSLPHGTTVYTVEMATFSGHIQFSKVLRLPVFFDFLCNLRAICNHITYSTYLLNALHCSQIITKLSAVKALHCHFFIQLIFICLCSRIKMSVTFWI
ncbi:unnamed protein product [Oncorhynchus mykiss]|uniref:Uncharacterized protein n=1 Tax=Oncorhynchus mykiss TaxID=8022 RepID=A0A060VM80_ONCMY|nr:unnamed protein product [Oncorhynchus mykiss]